MNIYHDQPFAVSMNRGLLALLFSGFGLLLLFTLRFYKGESSILLAGQYIAGFYWIGLLIAGYLYGDYHHVSDDITLLDSFYSGSGTLISGIKLVVALFIIPFTWELYKNGKRLKINVLPILPLVFIALSMLGTTLFPSPNALYEVFANILVLSTLGPLLTVFIWRDEELSRIRWLSALSLFLMVVALGLIFSRTSIPAFVHAYWGLIQRTLLLGWTLWFVFLSLFFGSSLRAPNIESEL